MPIDVQRLTPTELVRLMNSTPLGTVITAPYLHRQMDKAGYRIGDGRTINFLRYASWLAKEHHKESGRPTYQDKMRRNAERDKLKTLTASDIAPVPEVANPERRAAATARLQTFCETYFHRVFYRQPWSDDHIRVLGLIEKCILDGGLFAFAMPRGSGKTSLARMAGLWAILTGARQYVCLIGGSEDRATDLLLNIRRVILSPDARELRDDFPEALYPLWSLRNNARKQIGQHINGEPTYCTWAADKLVFPTVSGDNLPPSLRDAGTSRCSGSIITVTSLDSNMRGQQHTKLDGTIVRPSLVLMDDPQTRASARSASQTATRLQLMNGDVLGMAGPGEKIAAFLTCTKIYEGDLADAVLDRKRNPQWQGICTKLVYSWPQDTKLWDQYRVIRDESLRQGSGGREATEFYVQNRVAMDEGSRVAWEIRKNDDEASAIQHAFNLRCDMGEEAFDAEYQNEPSSKQDAEAVMLSPQEVAERFNGRKRGEIPMSCNKITAFIDVHKEVLFWCAVAWQPDFTGFVVDYGSEPDQRRSYFTLANANRTLSKVYQHMGEDGAIQAGVEKLVTELLGRAWPQSGGGVLRIDRLAVDMGYKAALVAAVKHKVGGSAMMLSKGIGLRAGSKPISMYQRRPGWTLGQHWYTPSVRRTHEFPHVCNDVNYWKAFVHAHLAIAPGDPGALTLFGTHHSEHTLFAEHISGSETYQVTFGQGRQVQEWKLRPDRPDNHWFDCLVGCCAGASQIGVGQQFGVVREARKRVRIADLKAEIAR